MPEIPAKREWHNPDNPAPKLNMVFHTEPTALMKIQQRKATENGKTKRGMNDEEAFHMQIAFWIIKLNVVPRMKH